MLKENLTLYDIFRKDLHLSDNKAQELLIALDESSERYYSMNNGTLATKAELMEIKSELKREIHAVAVKVEQMATKVELSETKSDLKYHMSYVALAQLIVIIGSVITIIRYALVK